MHRLKVIFNFIFLFFTFFLFTSFSVISSEVTTDKPTKKIELVTRHKINYEFNVYHSTIDKENSRLFISSNNKIQIYNISNPENLTLLGEISQPSRAILKYHDGYLFFVNYTIHGQIITIYDVSDSTNPFFVGESSPFGYATTEDDGVRLMYFPSPSLMITCGAKLRVWDISDLTNITCLSAHYYNQLLYNDTFDGHLDCKGLAFHPDEPYLLIAVSSYLSGGIFLVSYTDPANLSVIDFDLTSFITNDSSLRIPSKISLISNGYFPCFSAGSQLLEIINWQNASKPVFGQINWLPDKDKLDHYPHLVQYKPNEILVYQILSGLINTSDLTTVKYLTDCNTDRSIYAKYEPQFLNNYLFFLEKEVIVQQGVYYYVNVMKITDINPVNNKNLLWMISLTGLIPIITIPILIKRKIKK